MKAGLQFPALTVLGCFVFLFPTQQGVSGHGRLRGPPSRSTMWRYGFRVTPNYNDHELNCGGFSAHWGINKGKCGLCGDDFRATQPRDNEGGGKYGRGIVVMEYSQGGIIDAEVEVTANHKGFFEFSICPHNRPREPASEDCFRLLELADGSGTRWPLLGDVSPKTYTIPLRLPPDVTCNQCVFRWYWKSGNNWGMENGRGGLGLGPQETFIACSDIAIRAGETRVISSSANGRPGRRPLIGAGRPITTTTATTTTARPTTPVRRNSHNEGGFSVDDSVESDEWEPEIAFDAQPDDAEVTVCRAYGIWSHVGGMNDWCVVNCERGFCPSSHCCCHC